MVGWRVGHFAWRPPPPPTVTTTTTTSHRANRVPPPSACASPSAPVCGVAPVQGGPHEHQIAGIATQLREVLTPAWKTYCRQLKANCKVLADALTAKGYT